MAYGLSPSNAATQAAHVPNRNGTRSAAQPAQEAGRTRSARSDATSAIREGTGSTPSRREGGSWPRRGRDRRTQRHPQPHRPASGRDPATTAGHRRLPPRSHLRSWPARSTAIGPHRAGCSCREPADGVPCSSRLLAAGDPSWPTAAGARRIRRQQTRDGSAEETGQRRKNGAVGTTPVGGLVTGSARSPTPMRTGPDSTSKAAPLAMYWMTPGVILPLVGLTGYAAR